MASRPASWFLISANLLADFSMESLMVELRNIWLAERKRKRKKDRDDDCGSYQPSYLAFISLLIMCDTLKTKPDWHFRTRTQEELISWKALVMPPSCTRRRNNNKPSSWCVVLWRQEWWPSSSSKVNKQKSIEGVARLASPLCGYASSWVVVAVTVRRPCHYVVLAVLVHYALVYL